MKCPCEECISLAICVYRAHIKCCILRDMFQSLDQNDEAVSDAWVIVHKSLPNLIMLSGENNEVSM